MTAPVAALLPPELLRAVDSVLPSGHAAFGRLGKGSGGGGQGQGLGDTGVALAAVRAAPRAAWSRATSALVELDPTALYGAAVRLERTSLSIARADGAAGGAAGGAGEVVVGVPVASVEKPFKGAAGSLVHVLDLDGGLSSEAAHAAGLGRVSLDRALGPPGRAARLVRLGHVDTPAAALAQSLHQTSASSHTAHSKDSKAGPKADSKSSKGAPAKSRPKGLVRSSSKGGAISKRPPASTRRTTSKGSETPGLRKEPPRSERPKPSPKPSAKPSPVSSPKAAAPPPAEGSQVLEVDVLEASALGWAEEGGAAHTGGSETLGGGGFFGRLPPLHLVVAPVERHFGDCAVCWSRREIGAEASFADFCYRTFRITGDSRVSSHARKWCSAVKEKKRGRARNWKSIVVPPSLSPFFLFFNIFNFRTRFCCCCCCCCCLSGHSGFRILVTRTRSAPPV